jgi:predicted HicB family RNase H-like nuclease
MATPAKARSSKKGKERGKRKIKRMNLNVDIALHDAFKAATAAQGKKMTDVLIEFIRDYVQEHPVPPPGKPEKESGAKS